MGAGGFIQVTDEGDSPGYFEAVGTAGAWAKMKLFANDNVAQLQASVQNQYDYGGLSVIRHSTGYSILQLQAPRMNAGSDNPEINILSFPNGTSEIQLQVVDNDPAIKISDTSGSSVITLTGAVTATGTITGNLTGNVTGNVSGTAATVTGAAQSNITSVGTLTGLVIADGSVSDPSLEFDGGSGNDGIYGFGNNVGLAIDGVNAMYTIKSSSNVSIAIGAWSGTVGSDKEVYRNSTFGTLYTSSSKRALKDNIQSISGSGAIIDSLNPVTFIAAPAEGETEDQKAWRERDLIYGFIAEEVAEIADGKLVLYDVEGESLVPSNWKTRDIIAVLAAELKSVRQRLTALES